MIKLLNVKRIGILIGLTLAIIVLFSPAPDGMSHEAWNATAVALLMSAFWISEALPLYVTALLPIILFPLLNQ